MVFASNAGNDGWRTSARVMSGVSDNTCFGRGSIIIIIIHQELIFIQEWKRVDVVGK